MKNRSAVLSLAEREASFYLYDEKSIIEHAAALRRSFPSAELLYSIKCNPNEQVARAVLSQGFGIDAASAGEVELAHKLGLTQDKIFYSAPGKSRSDILNSLNNATIIADSINEIERIRQLSSGETARLNIGIRINPSFSFDGGKGSASKFGIDEIDALAYIKHNANDDKTRINGIHVHIKSQELSAGRIAEYYKNVFMLAKRAEAAAGHELDYINFGSGIGIVLANSKERVDLEQLGERMKEQIREFRKTHPYTRILIESGRYAVGESGVYVTHVVDKKVSRGKAYVILQNTLNGFMRPSIAKLVEKYAGDSGELLGTEPLFSGRDAFEIETDSTCSELERVTLVGDLCTAADIVAEDILLPKLEEGNIVILGGAGSYAAALSPMQFSSKERPKEFILRLDGQITV